MVLTPDSIGSLLSKPQLRKQTSEAVQSKCCKARMAFGSIQHLQHFFTETSLSSKKNPFESAQYGLVPAIGRPGHVPATPFTEYFNESNLPPSPVAASQVLGTSSPRPTLEPYVKFHDIDPDTLLPGVCGDLASVAHA
ncbi:hypothetical protein AN958_06239 [Leucoagaricus sp. SymC.cos]|nr:hypothetical protein AN958_06239 [Leucoagaricus sp. SymC.cos]